MKPKKPNKQSDEDALLALMSEDLDDEEGDKPKKPTRNFVETEINLDNPQENEVLIDDEITDEEFEDKHTLKDEEFDLDEDEPTQKTEEAPEEEEVQDPPKKDVAKDKEELERKSRAQERIRELARQKDEALKKAQEAEKREIELKIGYAKQMTTRLGNEITLLEKQLKEALQENDADGFIAAQKALSEAVTSKTQLDRFLDDAPKVAAQQPTQKPITSKDVQDKANLPEAARDWLEMKSDYLDTNKYKTLPLDVRKKVLPIRLATFEVSRTLQAEGYDPEDPSFYEELDLRLSAKFDNYEDLALLGIDVLLSDDKDKSSAETLKPGKKKTTLPVSTSVRSTSSSKSSKKGPTRIKITADQLDFYKNHLSHIMTWDQYKKNIEQDLKAYGE